MTHSVFSVQKDCFTYGLRWGASCKIVVVLNWKFVITLPFSMASIVSNPGCGWVKSIAHIFKGKLSLLILGHSFFISLFDLLLTYAVKLILWYFLVAIHGVENIIERNGALCLSLFLLLFLDFREVLGSHLIDSFVLGLLSDEVLGVLENHYSLNEVLSVHYVALCSRWLNYGSLRIFGWINHIFISHHHSFGLDAQMDSFGFILLA